MVIFNFILFVMTAGYSKTPLAKKLGIKPSFSLMLVCPPENYFSLFDDLPEPLELLTAPQPESADFIHLFVTSKKDLEEKALECKVALKKQGLLWVSWPKGGSGINTDLKRDWIREFCIEIGLVDIKVAAVNETWSGLKFVYPLKDR
jgi:hypothetical protein